MPGPGEYKVEESMRFLKTQKVAGKNSFISNIDRFKRHSEEVPGPGQYTLQGAMQIRSATHAHASFRSNVKKELKFQIDKDVPGIGVYNPQDHKTLGMQQIQGGAPNNFSLLAKKQQNNLNLSQINSLKSTITKDEKAMNISPRAILVETSSMTLMINDY